MTDYFTVLRHDPDLVDADQCITLFGNAGDARRQAAELIADADESGYDPGTTWHVYRLTRECHS